MNRQKKNWKDICLNKDVIDFKWKQMEGTDVIRNVLQNRFHYDKIIAMENDKKITIFFTCPIYQQIQGIC